MSGIEIVVVVAAVTIGALLQGCTGIGLALVAGPLLVSIDPGFAPAPLLLLGAVVNLRNLVAERAHLDRPAWKRSVAGIPLGVAGAVGVLAIVSDGDLAIVIGVTVCVASAALLSGIHPPRSNASEVATGAGTAFAGIAAGLPGPPLVIGYHDSSGGELRAMAGYLVTIIAIIGIVTLAATGDLGGDEWALTALALPGVAAGLVLARFVRPLVDRAWFRSVVLIISFLGGLALLIKELV